MQTGMAALRAMLKVMGTETRTATATDLGWQMGTVTVAPFPTTGWAAGFRAG